MKSLNAQVRTPTHKIHFTRFRTMWFTMSPETPNWTTEAWERKKNTRARERINLKKHTANRQKDTPLKLCANDSCVKFTLCTKGDYCFDKGMLLCLGFFCWHFIVRDFLFYRLIEKHGWGSDAMRWAIYFEAFFLSLTKLGFLTLKSNHNSIQSYTEPRSITKPRKCQTGRHSDATSSWLCRFGVSEKYACFAAEVI